MLLVDDDDELPQLANEAETQLAARLGPSGLAKTEESLRRHVQHRWRKVARVVAEAVRDGGFPVNDETVVRLHVRRLRALVESGALEGEGNLRKPRWSEVRMAGTDDST